MMLKVLSLFAGIGGFDLGLERTGGFRTVAFCEIDPFCQKVLAKHWPGVPIYDDVQTLTAERLADDGIGVDVVCGGFPCQDISVAGAGAGIAGERSGLWSEYARLIGEIRPLYVIVENVAALLGRGLGAVLGDLAALGYDAEWHCIPASAVGAPHRRDRVWIMAYPNQDGCVERPDRQKRHFGPSQPKSGVGCPDAVLADPESRRLAARDEQHDSGHAILLTPGSCERGRDQFRETWRLEPDVGRVAHGLPAQMDRLQSLGNAVVPQIPELIGRAILASEQRDSP